MTEEKTIQITLTAPQIERLLEGLYLSPEGYDDMPIIEKLGVAHGNLTEMKKIMMPLKWRPSAKKPD